MSLIDLDLGVGICLELASQDWLWTLEGECMSYSLDESTVTISTTLSDIFWTYIIL